MSDNRFHGEPAPGRGFDLERRLEMSARFLDELGYRRSIRQFTTDPVDRRLIENALAAANSAPSGANLQPWRFVVVSDPAIKKQIREGAEDEEREFYAQRASMAWLEALEPIGTVPDKPHLEDAPYLIVVFEVGEGPDAPRPYYLKESVGIAMGFLIAALNEAGLGTLVHTPSPMRFLNQILGRPGNERPAAVIVVGHPSPDAVVPKLIKKGLDDVVVWKDA